MRLSDYSTPGAFTGHKQMSRFFAVFIAFLGAFLGALPAAAESFEAFRADRLLLTWQRDPATTMTIQWLSERRINPPVDVEPIDDGGPLALPYIGPVPLDGSGGWTGRGLAVPYLVQMNLQVPDPSAFSARAWLGWNEQGVVVFADVRARERHEHEESERLVHGDSVSLYMMDDNSRFQLVVAPGGLEGQPNTRHIFQDTGGRAADVDELTAEIAVRHEKDGKDYRIEMLVPWSNLGRDKVEAGMDLFLQFHVINHDGPRGSPDRNWVSLNANNPRHPHYRHTKDRLAAFRLAPPGSAAPKLILTGTRVEPRVDARGEAVRVRVTGGEFLLGRTVHLYSGRTRIASGRFTPWERQGLATINVPPPPEGRRWDTLRVLLEDDTPLGVVRIPHWFMQRSPEPVRVRYWKAGSDERHAAVTRVSPVAQWRNTYTQRVELTGLEPDTEYRFQVDGYDDYGFRTMPATLDEPVRLAVGGNVRHNQRRMERTNRMVMKHRPRAIIWGGGLAYANGDPSNLQHWREWFDANHNTLIDGRRVVTPILAAIGNPDVWSGHHFRSSDYEPNDAWRESVAPCFYSLFAFPGQPGHNVLDFGDYLSLIILDSDHTAPVGGEQTRWLEEVLAGRRHVRNLFPVYHVPAYPSVLNFDDRTSAAIRQHWAPLFEQSGVRLVFEHHDHAYKRSHPIRNGEAVALEEGVVYIGGGAWGSNLREPHDVDGTWYLKEARSMHHALIVTLHPTHTEVRVHSADGELIDEVDIPVSP
ncbi:MAG: hypothetical protein JJU05_08820 [Verrucomicrobia bacterium]|nr:hypothetical protein [Verrucomicrobiota bacterium]MCH8527008.1 hypothetical protein [Kiritimatiellia bacterium]